MTMTSYAQNQEDVLLRRLFPPGRPGFYIDVGANDPVVDSITKHFYDHGWSGVNVEPALRPFERLADQRDRDVNLNVGLSDKEGALPFYEFPAALPGSSTFSLDQAERHRVAGAPFVERSVPVITLAAICEEHVRGPIDFLTIDTEGHELQVLEGGDWSRWRPRVVVIEAIQPSTLIPTHGAWEHVLLGADYVFAAFDGLNRFYLRKEDADLLPALDAPANVCDDFIPFKYGSVIADLRFRLDVGTQSLVATRAVNQALRSQHSHMYGQLAWSRSRHEALEGSLRTHREQYAAIRAAMAELEGVYVKLEAESFVARSQTEDLRRLLGSGTMALAIRMAALSERVPMAKTAARSLLRGAKVAQRAARGRRA